MKIFRINIFTRWAMKKERERLARSGQFKFTTAIEPDRASYWIKTHNLPEADAKMLDILDPFAAKLAGLND